jgi:hypothetical protein
MGDPGPCFGGPLRRRLGFGFGLALVDMIRLAAFDLDGGRERTEKCRVRLSRTKKLGLSGRSVSDTGNFFIFNLSRL